MVSKRIAVIPARGGSSRIPGKNILDFHGKPMIAWTIEAAIQTGLFCRVLVSTDDPTTAEVAKAWGAEAPFLRGQFADDHTPVSRATVFAVQQASDHWRERYDTVVQLMANCPLRGAEDIQHAVSLFDENDRRFQVSCFKYGWSNPWWALQLDSRGEGNKLFPEAAGERSQDLPELYCPTGATWVADVASLIRHQSFYGPGHVFEPMPFERSVDIDDKDDLRFAQALFAGLPRP